VSDQLPDTGTPQQDAVLRQDTELQGAGGGAASAAELIDGPGEALARVSGSDRLLWTGAGIALVAHLLPFAWWGQPETLGEGVLTEAIAVELVDQASIEGLDQTPAARPAPPAPPPAPPAQQLPPGPRQKAQQAVPPAPPPAPPREQPQAEKAEAKPPTPAPPAFDGDSGPKTETKPEPKEAKKAEPVKDKADASEQQPQPPRPKPRPPQQATAPPAPPPQQSAKPAPPRAASSPAQAKSGEVTKFAKEVVAALAKAKPNTPGIKGKVTVTVVVAFGGGVRVAKVTGSSGREDLDKLALEAAKKAPLPAPPPDVATDDLFYDVEYDFK
jgi:protein TonB